MSRLRHASDRAFTIVAYGSIFLMVAALGIILGPMILRGSTAVIFRGTVEWRRMQLERFERGDPERLREELEAVTAARAPLYAKLEEFQQGLDAERQIAAARRIFREYRDEMQARGLERQTIAQYRRDLRQVRDALTAAYETQDAVEALAHLDAADAWRGDERFMGTVAEEYFRRVDAYRQVVRSVDLERREVYLEDLNEVREALAQLLGPLPGDPPPALPMNQYGATRWDQAEPALQRLLYRVEWEPADNGEMLVQRLVPRRKAFEGTVLAGLFDVVEQDITSMLNPRWTFYPQFFTDPTRSNHFFGGIGDEVLGTLLLTLVCMLIATPLGIVSAAYLAEAREDHLFVRVLRTCINSLAGVPSIVFGLFGLAFFVLWFLPGGALIPRFEVAGRAFGPVNWPGFGLSRESSILAGGLTLAVLVLPVIIRASEEAIRAVPQTYKEASLALGAGRLRAFVTVILPAALPGILTGIILSLSRAAGETAPILFTAVFAIGPRPGSVTQPTAALSYGSFMIATADNIGPMVPHKQYGMIMTLILLVLVLNVLAILLRSRAARKLRGQ